jgi:Zn-dependent protease
VSLFGSIVLHELAHARVARAHGVASRGITLAALGGRAELEGALPSPKVDVLMAVAGPAANGVLAGLALALTEVAQGGHWPAAVTGVLGFAAATNALLTAVNLLPVFPLDGGRVLRAALWHRTASLSAATRTARRIGMGFGVGLVVAGVVGAGVGHRAAGLTGVVVGLYLYRRARLSSRGEV